MENAVIGVFDDYQHAVEAADALVAAGFRQWEVQITPKEESEAARQSALDDRERYSSGEGWSIGSFFRSLFGTDADHEHAHAYSEALRRGSFLVTCEAEGEGPIQQAREVMGQFHPIDIEERASHWRSRGWSRYEAGSPAYSDHEVHAERSAYGAGAGSGTPGAGRGNDAVRSFERVRGGASPGGGSDIGGIRGGGVTGDLPAAEVNQRLDSNMNQSDTAAAGGEGLLRGADQLRSEDASTSTRAAAPAGGSMQSSGGMHTGSMSDMASMSGMTGPDVTGMGGRSMPNPPGQPGMTTGSRAADQQLQGGASQDLGMQAQGRTPSLETTERFGGGAGFGSDQRSQPTGSGGTLGSLGAGNSDLHESAGTGSTAMSATSPTSPSSSTSAMSGGSMMGESMGGGSMARAGNTYTSASPTAAGMAGDATDRVREEVMGGESLGRDTMAGQHGGSTHEAMGAGSSSGDPTSTGGMRGRPETLPTGGAMRDESIGRQGASGVHAPSDETGYASSHETSGVMRNAAQRDSTAPDIYTVDHDADYRTHWQKSMGVHEGRYEEFEPAYRFGADLRHNQSYKSYHNWNEIEPEARRDWESNYADSPWDKARDAVRYAWERLKE